MIQHITRTKEKSAANCSTFLCLMPKLLMQLCDVSLVSSWVFQCVCVCVRVSPDCTHPTHLHGPPSSSYILLCSLLQLSDCRGVPFSVRVVAPVPIPHVSLVTSDLSSFLHRSWLESGFFCPFVYCLW